MRSAIVFLVSLLIVHAVLAAEFVTHELPEGVKIETPEHWKVLSKDMRKNIRAATEAMAEHGNVPLRKTTNVLHVNATPDPTGAIVRVTIGPPSQHLAASVRGLSHSDLVELQHKFETQLIAVQNLGGPELLESYLPQIELISGIPSVAWSYRRRSITGQGTWHVTQYKVPTPSMLLELTISYRETDSAIWRPILNKVRQSVSIPR